MALESIQEPVAGTWDQLELWIRYKTASKTFRSEAMKIRAKGIYSICDFSKETDKSGRGNIH